MSMTMTQKILAAHAGLESVTAGKMAANGENPVGDSLYFLNPKTATSYWILRTRVFYRRISNHDFYK